MADKYELSSYNAEIAKASSHIGQRLFAYISNGKDINDRIRTKFAKSLIFIGDEGQIYNPLTNTYVGIGQTAYIHTISYIEDAQEKIKTLQKMLASSMVSSIYANWYKDEWSEATGEKANSDVNYSTPYYSGSQLNASNVGNTEEVVKPKLPSKIYATNEIILKGKGDYDPTTKLAATREYAHIVDKNNTKDTAGQEEKNLQYLLDHTYKEVKPAGAFATSGITVSLEKGLNRYLYSYTFTAKGDGAYIGSAPDATPYSKVFNIYLTIDDYEAGVRGERPGDIVDEDNINESGEHPKVVEGSDKVLLFYQGLVPQYNDGYKRRPETEAEYNESGETDTNLQDYEANKALNLRNQLFKQNANTLVIDDTLTWSYVASAYSYTVNFAKEYTDAQVTQIYRDILGENTTRLIPVTQAQVHNQLVNPDAKLNADRLIWNEATGKWEEKVSSGDGQDETSENLSVYKLNYSSTFVGRYQLKNKPEELTSLAVNTGVEITGQAGTATVLPWLVLAQLSKEIAKATEEAKKEHESAWTNVAGDKLHIQETPEELYEHVRKAAERAIYNFSYTSVIGTAETPFRFVANPDPNASDTDICNAVEEITKQYYFMDFENDSRYAHEGEDFDRDISFNQSKGDADKGEAGIVDETGKGQYGSDKAEPDRDYGYTGKNYSLPFVYRIITDKNVDDIVIEKNDKDEVIGNRALFAVNTNWTSMSGINLADGINTLKEIAYVLDIITDGWGNQYNPDDPEGSGILLTYTIANNHERIEDHEKRLRALEGGKNIVKAIYADEHTTGKYVDIHLASDTSWICTLVTQSTPDNSGVWNLDASGTFSGLNTTTDWFGVFEGKDNSGVTTMYAYAVPHSYIVSYNALMEQYLTHKAKHPAGEADNDYVCPQFSDIYDANKFGIFNNIKQADTDVITFKGFVEAADPTVGPQEQVYFKDDKNQFYPVGSQMRIPTYVGQVGIGIDLKLATTYTSSIFCDDDNSGFIAVDLNSSLVKKAGVLTVALPKHIPHDKVSSFIYDGAEADEPKINYSEQPEDIKRYADPAFIKGATINLNNDIVTELTTLGLGSDDAKIINDYISNYLPLASLTITTEEGDIDCIGAKCSMKFEITPTDAVNNTTNAVTNEYDYLSNLYEVTTSVSVAGLTSNLGYTEVTGDKLVVDVKDIPYVKNYYIRLNKLKNQKQVSLTENALTDVEWVTTYVSHVVSDVARKLKDVELESYQYTKGLINQLDSYYEARDGKYVAGIEQLNGVVTPILRDLPQDTITAGVKVWGENTIKTKIYTEVDNKADIITAEIGMDTPLFVQTADFDYQEIPAYNENLAIVTAPEVTLDGKTVYEFDDVKNDFVVVKSVERFRSSFIAGRDYAMFMQYYFRTPKYVRIDAADIVIPGKEDPDPQTCSYTLAGTEYKVFYKLDEKATDEVKPVETKEYISAESFHQIDETGGAGENVLKVTAHITKLSDATENNSGLVDAYDVKNTIDNMFEWVDLSRWDLDYEANNPVNTSYEEFPPITAAERINDTKSNSNNIGRVQMGYPKEMYKYSDTEHIKPDTSENPGA